jgi:hypothetical protein
MTTVTFNKAIALDKEIRKEQDMEIAINCLINRTYETTGEYQKFVKVQLGEGYAYTPQPEVRLDKWLEFLKAEKQFINDHVAELTKQFEEL